MPKMKTHSGTKNILTKKSKKRKLLAGHDAIVHTSDEKRIKHLLTK